MGIYFDEKLNIFMIQTENSTYAFSKDDNGYLTNLYWGGRLDRIEDLPETSEIKALSDYEMETSQKQREEFCTRYRNMFREPGVLTEFFDGARDCDLRYFSHEISEDSSKLKVILKDSCYPFYAELHYKIYKGLDLLEKHTVFRNGGKEEIKITSAMSSCLYLPECRDYNVTLMGSSWGREYHIERKAIPLGKLTIESRTLYSNSNNFPYFAIDSGELSEESGEVYFGTLQWCGNYKINIERKRSAPVYITAGLNDFDFEYTLEENEKIDTPVLTVGYTKNGIGAASRMLHALQKDYIAPREFAYKPQPVVYNPWSAFEFDINTEKLSELAKMAKDLGAELFVVDDGWYSEKKEGTPYFGDWYSNKEKFPDGLTPLIEKVNSLGMKFGLWIEPEMVHPNSKLYKEHSDWVFDFPTRELDVRKERLRLNLAKAEVKEYIKNTLDKLLSENNIEYLKWDSNRFLGQSGMLNTDKKAMRAYHYLYTKAIYEIFDFINKKHPNVLIENCAAGGMRADMSLAHYCTRINRSDNQDPRDELFLHEGFTLVHRPKAAGGGGHISKSPSLVNGRYAPLKFKAYAGMLGSLAIGYDLRELTKEQFDEIKGYVSFYKEHRELINNGDLYRLVSARDNDFAVYEYVSQDKSEAIVFAFGLNISFADFQPYVRLQGLDPESVYILNGEKRMSGRGLKEVGILFKHLMADFDCDCVYLKKAE